MSTMEFYSVVRKDEILCFASTWVEPEGVIFSEISQRKDKYLMISFICSIYEDKVRQWVVSDENKPLDLDNRTKVTKWGGGRWGRVRLN